MDISFRIGKNSFEDLSETSIQNAIKDIDKKIEVTALKALTVNDSRSLSIQASNPTTHILVEHKKGRLIARLEVQVENSVTHKTENIVIEAFSKKNIDKDKEAEFISSLKAKLIDFEKHKKLGKGGFEAEINEYIEKDWDKFKSDLSLKIQSVKQDMKELKEKMNENKVSFGSKTALKEDFNLYTLKVEQLTEELKHVKMENAEELRASIFQFQDDYWSVSGKLEALIYRENNKVKSENKDTEKIDANFIRQAWELKNQFSDKSIEVNQQYGKQITDIIDRSISILGMKKDLEKINKEINKKDLDDIDLDKKEKKLSEVKEDLYESLQSLFDSIKTGLRQSDDDVASYNVLNSMKALELDLDILKNKVDRLDNAVSLKGISRSVGKAFRGFGRLFRSINRLQYNLLKAELKSFHRNIDRQVSDNARYLTIDEKESLAKLLSTKLKLINYKSDKEKLKQLNAELKEIIDPKKIAERVKKFDLIMDDYKNHQFMFNMRKIYLKDKKFESEIEAYNENYDKLLAFRNNFFIATQRKVYDIEGLERLSAEIKNIEDILRSQWEKIYPKSGQDDLSLNSETEKVLEGLLGQPSITKSEFNLDEFEDFLDNWDLMGSDINLMKTNTQLDHTTFPLDSEVRLVLDDLLNQSSKAEDISEIDLDELLELLEEDTELDDRAELFNQISHNIKIFKNLIHGKDEQLFMDIAKKFEELEIKHLSEDKEVKDGLIDEIKKTGERLSNLITSSRDQYQSELLEKKDVLEKFLDEIDSLSGDIKLQIGKQQSIIENLHKSILTSFGQEPGFDIEDIKTFNENFYTLTDEIERNLQESSERSDLHQLIRLAADLDKNEIFIKCKNASFAVDSFDQEMKPIYQIQKKIEKLAENFLEKELDNEDKEKFEALKKDLDDALEVAYSNINAREEKNLGEKLELQKRLNHATSGFKQKEYIMLYGQEGLNSRLGDLLDSIAKLDVDTQKINSSNEFKQVAKDVRLVEKELASFEKDYKKVVQDQFIIPFNELLESAQPNSTPLKLDDTLSYTNLVSKIEEQAYILPTAELKLKTPEYHRQGLVDSLDEKIKFYGMVRDNLNNSVRSESIEQGLKKIDDVLNVFKGIKDKINKKKFVFSEGKDKYSLSWFNKQIRKGSKAIAQSVTEIENSNKRFINDFIESLDLPDLFIKLEPLPTIFLVNDAITSEYSDIQAINGHILETINALKKNLDFNADFSDLEQKRDDLVNSINTYNTSVRDFQAKLGQEIRENIVTTLEDIEKVKNEKNRFISDEHNERLDQIIKRLEEESLPVDKTAVELGSLKPEIEKIKQEIELASTLYTAHVEFLNQKILDVDLVLGMAQKSKDKDVNIINALENLKAKFQDNLQSLLDQNKISTSLLVIESNKDLFGSDLEELKKLQSQVINSRIESKHVKIALSVNELAAKFNQYTFYDEDLSKNINEVGARIQELMQKIEALKDDNREAFTEQSIKDFKAELVQLSKELDQEIYNYHELFTNKYLGPIKEKAVSVLSDPETLKFISKDSRKALGGLAKIKIAQDPKNFINIKKQLPKFEKKLNEYIKDIEEKKRSYKDFLEANTPYIDSIIKEYEKIDPRINFGGELESMLALGIDKVKSIRNQLKEGYMLSDDQRNTLMNDLNMLINRHGFGGDIKEALKLQEKVFSQFEDIKNNVSEALDFKDFPGFLFEEDLANELRFSFAELKEQVDNKNLPLGLGTMKELQSTWNDISNAVKTSNEDRAYAFQRYLMNIMNQVSRKLESMSDLDEEDVLAPSEQLFSRLKEILDSSEEETVKFATEEIRDLYSQLEALNHKLDAM